MNTSIMKNVSVNSKILSNLLKRLSEAEICPDDALDELINVDPNTELGRALTKMMTYVSALGLFDYYKGYTREPGEGSFVRSFFSNDAQPESMEKLINRIEADIEGPVIDEPDAEAPIIKAKLTKTSTGCEFTWVVELRIFSQKPGEEDIPVDVKVDGDVEVDGSNDVEKEDETTVTISKES